MATDTPEGQIWCLVRQRYIESAPEEEVRQAVLKCLTDDRGYRYPVSRLDVELPVRLRRTERPRYADVVIYAEDDVATARERRRVLAIIEIKDPETDEDGYDQAEGYASHKLAEYAAFVDSVVRHRLRGRTARLVYRRDFAEGQPAPHYQPVPISDIPLCGEEVSYRVNQLRPFLDVREAQRVLRRCHDFIREAGRDPLQAFADMSRILFAKVADELSTPAGEIYQFQVGVGETDQEVSSRIELLLSGALDRYDLNRDTFAVNETIALPADKVRLIVELLQPYSLTTTELDIKGQAFQTFLGANLRGEGLGQYFTPRTIVRFMTEVVSPTHDDRLIDPACGTAGFLLDVLNHVRGEIEEAFRGRSAQTIFGHKLRFAQNNLVGLEWHPDVARSAKVNMLISDDGRGNIFEGIDSLVPLADLPSSVTRQPFTIAITNPPFGTAVRGPQLAQFRTAHKTVVQDGETREVVMDWQDSKVLFIERCLQLLGPGGRMAIVLPNGVLNNPGSDAVCVRKALSALMVVDGVVRLTPDAFQHVGTGSKTSVLFARKRGPGIVQGPIFMGRVSNVGYNARGGEIAGNQLPGVAEALCRAIEGEAVAATGDLLAEGAPLVYVLPATEQAADPLCRWDPCYFEPHHRVRIAHLRKRYQVLTLGDALEDATWHERRGTRRVVTTTRKVVAGRASRTYVRPGTSGAIPVLMIGNIVEVNAQYVLDLLSPQWIAGNDHEFIMDSAVAAGDVLVARTGATIGKVAVVPDGAPSPLNICSDILRLRPSGIDPYYLAAFLASDLGQRQLYANISGSTNEHLSPEALELVQVPLLPDAEEIGRSYRECVRERLERDFAARALFDHMETDLSD